ncbi:MAG: hypothetical protein AAF725_18220 [Acidobacteriota bacterium]
MAERPAALARENPFRASRLESLRFRLSPAGWNRLLERWAAHGYRGALVGPHGSGKTTLLDEIAARRSSGRAVRLRFSTEKRGLSGADRRLVEKVGPRDLVTVDGAEQLGPWGWRRLRRGLRPAGAVLVTAHRPGFLPTIHRHAASPELLAELVAELMGDEVPGRSPRQTLEWSPRLAAELPRLYARHRGNLRECFFELYSRWAEGGI